MKTLKQRTEEALAAGFTIGDLAKAGGVTSAAASHWLSGATKSLKAHSAAGLAELTGWHATWWANGTGERGATKARAAAPALHAALPVVLDAMAAAPARGELRTLLQMLVDSDSPLYRQRLAELLAAKPDPAASAFVSRMNSTAPVAPVDVPLRGLSVKPPPPVDQSAPPSEAGPRPSAAGSAAPPSAGARKAQRP